ncbi:DICT sensory domain-containing protein [Halobacterium rubrum]|uniref:DICT sensory domain-containing protein n=1 Tax=Halobacterium TaxID=2239 RepID=UPI001F1FE013|nr:MULTISPECIES: DICT sensory domain-containing protein [Halobacterium]MDH5018945.1 DICT sensory domain-containing protein [Halobacterium rubrum]
MSPGNVLEAAADRRKRLTHYAPERGEFADRFAARNVDVSFRRLPPGGPDPFVVVRDAGGSHSGSGDDESGAGGADSENTGERPGSERFRGAVTVATLERLLAPPRATDERAREAVSPAYGAVLDLLDDTVFASLSRRQLLATTREFEDRAWRAGDGLLHVGFQTADAFADQQSLYHRLAADTSLDVHVHLADERVDAEEVAVHAGGEYADRYWFVAFDGPGDSQCALVAEQRDGNDDDYVGAWTYDPDLVAGVVEDLADWATG